MLKAEEGDFEEVRKLLKDPNQANVNLTNRNGYTALALACKGGFYRVADALIQAGSDLNIKNNVLFYHAFSKISSLAKVLCSLLVGITSKRLLDFFSIEKLR